MSQEQKIEEILSRGVEEVINQDHLKERLLSGEKLHIKFGVDPTSPNLHIGRAVPLLKLKDFQELGHKVTLIIGDFTAEIGDTSDKSAERQMLTPEQVKKNLETYAEQAGKILDLEKIEVRHNSEWLNELNYKEVVKQANVFSMSEFISRKNIKKRLDEEKRISVRELLYPLMQGYDSVVLKNDVEVGGTDQRFNMLTGRKMQEMYEQKPQDILTVNLILGTDGRKMSSSWGNAINLNDKPEDMFGKIMSIPDDLIISYFENCTRVPMTQVKDYEKQLQDSNNNPRDIKMNLASEITAFYWGQEEAQKAQKHFIDVFQKKDKPDKIKEVSIEADNILDALVKSGLVQSKGEARRAIEQGGVKIDKKKVESLEEKIKKGCIIQKGKRHFIKIK